MALSNKPLEALAEADLQALIADQVAEDKTIEYKEKLPSSTYADRKEFAADVSSFANASGGHILFGMRAEQGIASDLIGLEVADLDAEVRRLDNMIRDCIEPRIPGIHLRGIVLQSGNVAIVVQIPRSWALPHVAKIEGHWRFYARNSAGKYPLDVSEVRAAFALSESTGQRIRGFRVDRLASIEAGEAPITLPNNAKLVLHLVPVSSFDPSNQYDLQPLAQKYTDYIGPISSQSWDARHNLDGYLTFTRPSQRTHAVDYLQVYRNGTIEAVNMTMFDRHLDGRRYIPGRLYEEELLDALPRYIKLQQALGVDPPIVVMLSFLGVLGYTMAVHRSLSLADKRFPIDRDTLVIPEVLLEQYDAPAADVMKPIFDVVWNATGWPGSQNYSDDGQWVNR